MNRNLGFVLGLAVSGLAAYGLYRATRNFPWDATGTGDADRAVTEASEDSFPASDAPSHTPVTGSVAG
jgi:hypothetical protein